MLAEWSMTPQWPVDRGSYRPLLLSMSRSNHRGSNNYYFGSYSRGYLAAKENPLQDGSQVLQA